VVRASSKYGYTVALVGLSFLVLASLGGRAAGPTVSGSASSSALISPTIQSSQVATPTPEPPEPTPAVLAVSPADLAVDVRPDVPVTVRASSGTLRAVALIDGKGNKVAGEAGTDGTWGTSELLRPSTPYTFTIAATGPDGTLSTTTSRFRTLRTKVTATYSLIPRDGIVGVGMPVIVQFDSAVTTKARRAEVEKRVKVTTVPAQSGAWGWLDDRQLMWRPRSYWTPGTKVTLATALHGVQTGDKKWITADDKASFTVGSSMVSSVDMKAHTLTVRRNGKVVHTFPVSTGKPGRLTETRSGTKVIIERNNKVVMDSATVGIPKGNPNYYRISTKWNLRLTWTGEFIHSAPWSVNSQGSQNVSHGCTNMAPANAEWMFRNSKMGDLVLFTGSSRVFQPTEGIGVWAYSYAGWKAQSALS
jgi:lipoprotein-anchoring transpeptidase ErfK/SrfK